MGRRTAKPKLSAKGEREIGRYGGHLRDEQDLACDTVRNHLSDLRQFVAFCEVSRAEGNEPGEPFSPVGVTTPTIPLYRSYKNALGLKPATINRRLISIKHYFGWTTDRPKR